MQANAKGQLDPGQIRNYFTNAKPASTYALAGRTFEDVVHRLDALMMVLKSCKARECRHPWETLHPDGDVHSLKDALSKRYDSFYQEQPKVAFAECKRGYLKALEGPQNVNVYGGEGQLDYLGSKPVGQKTFNYKGHWSHWT